MKKFLTIVTTALIAIAVVSCNSEEKPNNEEVRKLPSRTVEHLFDGELKIEIEYFYDVRRRLIKIDRRQGEVVHITYNSDDLPIRVERHNDWRTDIVYQDNGKTIILSSVSLFLNPGYLWTDTLWLNDKGQLIRFKRSKGLNIDKVFSYDSNGNIATVTGWIGYAEYSDIPSIWRHANIPDWFFYWLWYPNMFVMQPQRSGYMFSGFYYTLNADNYVTEIKTKDGNIFLEIEYILVN